MCSPTRSPRIRVDAFGFLPGKPPEVVKRYTITNKNGATVRLISLGAGIQSLRVPNRNGDIADVVLGFDNVVGYLEHRYIGRIVERSSGPFRLSRVASDYWPDGVADLDMLNWESSILGLQVVMTLLCRDDLMLRVKFDLDDENRLHVSINGVCTRPTPIGLACHCLFNLAGHGMGAKELQAHVIKVNVEENPESRTGGSTASGDSEEGRGEREESTERSLATDSLEEICETIYDLLTPTKLNSKTLFRVPGGGYNHTVSIADSAQWYYRFHASITHPATGRILQVYSNHPVLQVYTGIDLPDPGRIYPPDLDDDDDDDNNTETFVAEEDRLVGKDGMPYRRFGCFGLIPQAFPETVDDEYFPPNILYPGKMYNHNITYDFGFVNGKEFV